MENKVKISEVRHSFTSRRSFLKLSGLTVVGAGVLMATGCSNSDGDNTHYPGLRNGFLI